MLQSRVLGRYLLPFALARSKLLQIGNQRFDLRAFGLALREVLLRLVGQALQTLPGAERIRSLRNEFFRSRMRIQQRALGRGTKQRLVLVLAMDVDEVLARGLELRERRGVAVDEAARAAAAVDAASQDHAAGIAGETALLEPIDQGRLGIDFEFGRQLGALGAFAHQGGIAAAADQELDRVDQDRLAGAGFPREHGESRPEFQGNFLEDDEVGYSQSP